MNYLHLTLLCAGLTIVGACGENRPACAATPTGTFRYAFNIGPPRENRNYYSPAKLVLNNGEYVVDGIPQGTWGTPVFLCHTDERTYLQVNGKFYQQLLAGEQ